MLFEWCVQSYLHIYFRWYDAFVEHGAVVQRMRMMMAITVAIIVIYIATVIVVIVVIVRAINLNAVIYVTMMVFGHPRR